MISSQKALDRLGIKKLHRCTKEKGMYFDVK